MKLRLKWVLISGSVILQILTVAAILISSYLSSERVLQGHARDIMENIAAFTIHEAQGYLAPARDAAHLTQRLADSAIVSDADVPALERYFLEQLALHPQFSGIYYATTAGDFIFVMRSAARMAGGYRTKLITVRDGRRTVELIWRAPSMRELYREFDPQDPYDPRTRPWYRDARAAGRLIWTRPYVFYTSQKPGVTTASPVYARTRTGDLAGVVGVDIEIEAISLFLSTLKVGKSGKALILNTNGDVIAFPEPEKLKRAASDGAGRLRLRKIDELDDILARKAFASLGAPAGGLDLKRPAFSYFSHAERRYHAMFAPFSNPQWPWVISIYLPEDDYLGPIKQNRRFNLKIGLLIALVAVLIGFAIARSIIRPMQALQSEFKAVETYDLETTFDKRSFIREIQETSDRFTQMKLGLEAYREENERQAHILRDKETKLRASLTSLVKFSDALIVLDADRIIQFLNPAAELLLHQQAAALQGRAFPYPVDTTRKTEITIPAAHGNAAIAEMFAVETEWEGRRALLVTLRDITEQKWAEKSLSHSNESLKQTVDELRAREQQLTAISNMAEMFQVCSSQRDVINVIGENMERLFPETSGAVYILAAGRHRLERVHAWGRPPVTVDNFTPEQCWALKKDHPHTVGADQPGLRCDHTRSDAQHRQDLFCVPIRNTQGQVGLLHLRQDRAAETLPEAPATLAARHDIAVTAAEHIALAMANVRMQAELQEQAIRDPLTGLYNRRYMLDFMRAELHRSRRAERPFALILADIDHFKHFNDRHGHDAGDHVLKRTAHLLLANIRAGDVCCRFGGEEFVMILPASDLAGAVERAETLRRAVAVAEMDYGGATIGPVTISLGVCAFPEHGQEYAVLIKQADAALYAAKTGGRNRTCSAPAIEDPGTPQRA